MLLRRARTVDILVHHAPFPFVDVVSGLLSDRSVLENPPLLAPLVLKSARSPRTAWMWISGVMRLVLAIAIGRILDDPALAGRLSEENLR
jgi:hypothetical protein